MNTRNYMYKKINQNQLSKLFYAFYFSSYNNRIKAKICFKLNSSGFYVCKHVKYCRLKIEDFTIEDFKGVNLKIFDDYEKEIICSSVFFNLTKVKKPKTDYYQERTELIKSIKSLDKDFDFLSPLRFSTSFKQHNVVDWFGKVVKLGIEFTVKIEKGIITEIWFTELLNEDTVKLTKKKALSTDFKRRLEKMYEQRWKEKIDLSQTPYFTLFNSKKSKCYV